MSLCHALRELNDGVHGPHVYEGVHSLQHHTNIEAGIGLNHRKELPLLWVLQGEGSPLEQDMSGRTTIARREQVKSYRDLKTF